MKLMFYAECEPYHFLSISLTEFISEAKSHDRIGAKEDEMLLHLLARNKVPGFLLIERQTPAIFLLS